MNKGDYFLVSKCRAIMKISSENSNLDIEVL